MKGPQMFPLCHPRQEISTQRALTRGMFHFPLSQMFFFQGKMKWARQKELGGGRWRPSVALKQKAINPFSIAAIFPDLFTAVQCQTIHLVLQYMLKSQCSQSRFTPAASELPWLPLECSPHRAARGGSHHPQSLVKSAAFISIILYSWPWKRNFSVLTGLEAPGLLCSHPG